MNISTRKEDNAITSILRVMSLHEETGSTARKEKMHTLNIKLTLNAFLIFWKTVNFVPDGFNSRNPRKAVSEPVKIKNANASTLKNVIIASPKIPK